MTKLKFIAGITAIALTLTGLKACKDGPETQGNSLHDADEQAPKEVMDRNTTAQETGFASALLKQYLEIKNALADDNSTETAEAATGFNQQLDEIQPDSLSEKKQDEVIRILQQARIHSEQISTMGIGEQRQHFAQLSQNMISLVGITGTEFTLYEQFCPMYNNNEGGVWLSTTEKIRNPYFGSSMLSCGAVRREFN